MTPEHTEALRRRVMNSLPWGTPLFELADVVQFTQKKPAAIQAWLQRGIIKTNYQPSGPGDTRLWSLEELTWAAILSHLTSRGFEPTATSEAAKMIALILLQNPLDREHSWLIISRRTAVRPDQAIAACSDTASLDWVAKIELPSGGTIGGIFIAIDLRPIADDLLPLILMFADLKIMQKDLAERGAVALRESGSSS